jgi:hypothetical protein
LAEHGATAKVIVSAYRKISKAFHSRTEVLQSGGTSLIGLAVHATGPASRVYGATF